MSDLKEVFDLWQNNLKFREEFKKNPIQALKNAGLELSAEDLQKIQLRLGNPKTKDEPLDDRISK